MKLNPQEAADTLYDLLDQEPERITIITGNVVVAQYKNYTVKLRAYEVEEREFSRVDAAPGEQ